MRCSECNQWIRPRFFRWLRNKFRKKEHWNKPFTVGWTNPHLTMPIHPEVEKDLIEMKIIEKPIKQK